MSSLISVHELSYSLPNGDILFQNFNLHLNKNKIGIVGKNGVGKSTLLKLIANKLSPTSGRILINGKVLYLPQKLNDFSQYSVAKILNVDKKLSALQRAEEGLASIEDINLIGENWELKNEVHLILNTLKLEYLSLERIGDSLSGGELMRCMLTRILIEKPDFVLLDEPTNNLDKQAKKELYNTIHTVDAGFLIVSHDRELLNKMDNTVEISNLGLKQFGGNYDFYLEQRKIENDAIMNKLKNTEELLKKQKKKEQEIKEKQSHKSSHGKERAIKQGMSAIEIGSKQGAAQKTESRLHSLHEKKTIQYQKNYELEKENLRENYNIIIDIKNAVIPARKKMILCKNVNFKYKETDNYLWKTPIELKIIGNERVSISGKNGSGKTTLIQLITGILKPSYGEIYVGTPNIITLDQKCSLLKENLNIFENLERFTSEQMPKHEIRVRAGRFLFYGEDIFKKCVTLSGGERLRAALACILATDKTPDIFILDEPTNNLDIDSINILVKSLNQFKGTLIVISHDSYFLEELKINRFIEL